MVKKANHKPETKVFRIELEPVNEFISLDELEAKLKRIAGGVGVRVISALPVDETAEQNQTGNLPAKIKESPN
ncbi:MAG TPA: hypothetical protein DIT97_15765 [Gimesia maris]|uniref:Uncharacterized protein n=1 Tax=Gimesia maris TaxID=122 RepID=A0A3D3R756_9PLAN|nr:hypothetical protein [Gimesia maris]